MHSAIHQQAILINRQNRVLPGHGANPDKRAANDESLEEELSTWQWGLMVFGNVIGGSLMLAAMFFLPQLITLVLVNH